MFRIYSQILYQIKRICLIVFGGMLISGAALMMVGGWLIWHGCQDWPTTDATIIKFDTKPTKRQRVEFDLQYEYTVDGETITGTELSPMTSGIEVNSRYASKKQKQFPLNQAFPVAYDPHQPTRGFLEMPQLVSDVLIYPGSVGCLGIWMIYLFVQTRRRRVPDWVRTQAIDRVKQLESNPQLLESVVDREHVVIEGVATHSSIGSLFGGWPKCRVAVVASPNDFAVVPGPYTRQGIVSCLITIALELSLSRILFWLPIAHSIVLLTEFWQRRINWRRLDQQQFDKLCSDHANVLFVSIDKAVVYGFDAENSRLWFRLPNRHMDDYITLRNRSAVDEFIGFVGLMQQSNTAEE